MKLTEEQREVLKTRIIKNDLTMDDYRFIEELLRSGRDIRRKFDVSADVLKLVDDMK